jgi:Fur family transcriptional regulator, ferric uptake regulator
MTEQRMTTQRKIIIEELGKVKSHPTAAEIYEMVRRKLPNISLGTVYRNLELLSEQGKIQKLQTAGSQKRFDGETKNHFHVRCISCHRVDDLPLGTSRLVEELSLDCTDYEILWNKLEFVGICPRCRSFTE